MSSSASAKPIGAGAVPAIADHARMLETLLSNLPGMVYRCRNDPDWTMLFVSEGSRELTGYAPAELNNNRRTSYAQIIVPEDRGRVWDAVQAALARRAPFELRYRITTAAGAQKWVWERGLGIFSAEGAVEHIEGFITDITATVCAEEELRASENRLALVFNAARDMMCLVKVEPGPAFRVVSVNEEYVRTVQRAGFNRSAGELAGHPFDEWKAIFKFSDDAWRTLVERYRRVVATGRPLHYEELVETPAGTFSGDTWLTPVRNPETGECEFVLYTSTDITDRKRAERDLRSSEEKFSKAFRASPDAISVSDEQTGQILDVNEGFERASGYAREQIIGRTSSELGLWTAPGDRARMMAELGTQGSVRDLQVVARSRTGKEGTFLLAAERVEIGGRACLVIVSRDITEQKRAEQALRESEEKSLKAFRATPDAVFITELETGRIIDVNEGGVRLFGYTRDEFIGRTTLELGLLRNPADRPRLIEAVRQGGGHVRDFEIVERTKAGVEMTLLLSCETIELGGRPHLVTIAHDNTAKRRAEEERVALEAQFRQAQKLEALGQLAGGIAHDFNNILTGILAYTELSILDADRPAEVRKHLVAVKLASERAGELVRQILTFSRRQAPERKPTRLSAVIGEALKLLRSTLPRTIEIVEEIDATAPVVLADGTQIHQVVMNLCTNAAHAMKDRPGRLTIRLGTFDAGAADGGGPRGVGPGRHAHLQICDTGRGMDAATLSHIFEPFFTTKAPGEGTGLGLAVVHGIVEEHDGVITVRSQPGAGTTFDLYFPEFSALDDAGATAEAPLPRGQGQRVLLVDDEETIVRAVADLLGRLGYQPIVHTDPREAWREFDANPAACDLVVTDLTMPHWTGIELARRILARRPGVPVLLSTGHSGAWTPESLRALGLRGMIGKPLSAARLADDVRAALAPAANKP